MEDIKKVPALRFPEFSGEWENKKIKDIATIKSGSTPLRSNKNFFKDGNIWWVKTTDLNNSSILKTEECITELAIKKTSIKIYPKNSVLVAMYGGFNQIGRTGILKVEATTNQALSILNTDEKKILPQYLLTWLNAKVKLWIKFSGSSRKDPNITGSDVKSFPISYPIILEQQKIADFLTKIDNKIEKLSKKKQLLESYKKGVMQKIFSQELRFKDDEGNNYPDWEEKKLGEVGEIITGKTPKTTDKTLWNGDIQFVTPTDITNEKYQYITQRTVKNIKLKILPKNSIMFTCIASIGKMSLSVNPCITNQQINSLIPRKQYNNEYLYYSILNISEYIKSTQANNTLPIINKTEFLKFKILLPYITEQTKIANFLTEIDKKINLVEKQLNDSKDYKKGLLQQMFV